MSEIKVGSEWTNHRGIKFKVLFVGGASAFCRWDNGREFNVPLGHFGDIYKEAPVRRTVWLNVYESHAAAYNSKQSADLNMSNAVLFQQEVELIDPRGGE